MELAMIMTYTAFCWAVFKIFKLPLNKWTVPTAILGGVVLIGLTLLLMNYNHPYTTLVREYYVTTPIVPNVEGQVIEVPVQANQPLNEGEVLFRIDPKPYQYEVDRLEAMLADANANVSQLEQKLRAAEAATSQARSDVLASESEFDRQAREALEQARAQVSQAKAQHELSREQYERYEGLSSTGAVARVDFDRAKRNFESAEAQLKQAQAAERQAAEKLSGGGDRLQSTREQLRRTKNKRRDSHSSLRSEA
jgi:multidrug resistance efflux pump